LLAAAGGFRLGHAFLSSGRTDQAERAATLAAEALEGQAQAGDTDALVLWGALKLVTGIAAARRADAPVARAALRDATEAALRLGPHRDERFGTEFGSPNVALHAVSVEVELGEATEALRLAKRAETAELSAERRARLLIDVARAHAQRRNPVAAMDALEHAERLAPEMVESHWLVRQTVRDLLRRERGTSRTARRPLAGRLGLT
jgi:hypothetical protein